MVIAEILQRRSAVTTCVGICTETVLYNTILGAIGNLAVYNSSIYIKTLTSGPYFIEMVNKALTTIHAKDGR